jgi:hypothetical protein
MPLPVRSIDLKDKVKIVRTLDWFARGAQRHRALRENPRAKEPERLFRSHEDVGEDGVKQALRDCIALGHELTNLEDLLGISRATITVATYSHAFPRSRWEAIQIGEHVALEERRRLGLGSAALADVSSLIEAQGIRTGTVSMPDSVSGLTISHPKVGPFIVINERHSRERRRFSWCHEYAHVLLDKDTIGMVSRESERNELREVRANSFAANFHLPEEGVRQFVAGCGRPDSRGHF